MSSFTLIIFTLIIIAAIALAAVTVALLVRLKARRTSIASASPQELQFLPAAVHYRYFAQIRRALSVEDSRYLRERVPPEVATRALRQRRNVALRFLKGLNEDFSNLARLGRMVAGLSPVISRHQEAERLLLTLKFHALFSLVWLKLSYGSLPVEQMEHLTGLVGQLAQRIEQAMAEIQAASSGNIPANLRT